MARVNFEDDVEAQDEFWTLLEIVGGNRDLALGRLLRFFRLAQRAFGHDQPMLEADLRAKGFGDMIESGWAVQVPGGFQALGAEKHFSWYKQKVEAGKRGGRPANEGNLPVPPANRAVPPANPLALAPAPAPVLAPAQKEKGATNLYAATLACKSMWLDTMHALGSPRDSVTSAEETLITRAIQKHGSDTVYEALLGARFEKAFEGFNPRENVDITRILLADKTGRERIQKFVELGARGKVAAKREQDKLQKKRVEEEAERNTPEDPERVREILARAGFGKRDSEIGASHE